MGLTSCICAAMGIRGRAFFPISRETAAAADLGAIAAAAMAKLAFCSKSRRVTWRLSVSLFAFFTFILSPLGSNISIHAGPWSTSFIRHFDSSTHLFGMKRADVLVSTRRFESEAECVSRRQQP